MNTTTVVNTDLVTPLGAYVRLREQGRAAFLLESVERGRLGRHSFVGCGSRIVDLAEAETCGEPVVGYVGYDYAAELEPTVPLPDEGPDLPRSRFVVPETLIRFDHVLGLAEVLEGDGDEIGERLDGALPPSRRRTAACAARSNARPAASATSGRSSTRSARSSAGTRSRWSCHREPSAGRRSTRSPSIARCGE